jgi:hypothetical protein
MDAGSERQCCNDGDGKIQVIEKGVVKSQLLQILIAQPKFPSGRERGSPLSHDEQLQRVLVSVYS